MLQALTRDATRTHTAAMKLKHLESMLEDVEPFREPDVMLEQYPTAGQLTQVHISAAPLVLFSFFAGTMK